MITSEYFASLDFWFYTVGVNVRPADTRNKKVSKAWADHQTTAMTAEEYELMKKNVIKK